MSERERQILWRAGEGKSGAEIAVDLRLSEGTVRNYLSEAINKLAPPIASRLLGWRAVRGGCKGGRNRRSLGSARDDKGEAGDSLDL